MQEHPNYKYRPRRRKHNKRGGPSPSGVPAASSSAGSNGNSSTSGVGAAVSRRSNPSITQHHLHQSSSPLHQLHQQKLQSPSQTLGYHTYQHPHNVGGYSPLLQQHQQHQSYQHLYSKSANSPSSIYAGSPYPPIMHTPEASPTGSPEPDSLRLGLTNRVSNTSSPLLQQPHHHAQGIQQDEQQSQQPDTTDNQSQQLPSTPQPPSNPQQLPPSQSSSSSTSSSGSSLIEDVNAAALPTPEMSPMDQDKDNFQFSGGTNSNSEDKRSVLVGVGGGVLVNSAGGSIQGGSHTNIAHSNLTTATTTPSSIGYHHVLSQHMPYHRSPSSVLSNYGSATSHLSTNLLHHHHHHHHHHHQSQHNALTATMGLSNGMMMMCTNQRLLDTYEHSGLVTGTFYPPVATSQDNQQLGVGSSNSSTGSSGHQMYTTANSTASPSLGSSYLGGNGNGSGSGSVYGTSGGGGGGGSSSTSGQGLPTSPSGSHYSCNSPAGAAHSLRTASDNYTTGVIMGDDQHSRNYHHSVVTAQSPHSHHVSYVSQSEEEDLILDDADGGVDTNEFDKYLKYSGGHHQTSHENSSEDPTSMHMDSNHNYHHHQHHSMSPNHHHPHQLQPHAYYNHATMESVILSNTAHILKSEPSGLHLHQQGLASYGTSEVSHVPQCDYSEQQQQIQQIKTEDDFSVILADVRKTCYSS